MKKYLTIVIALVTLQSAFSQVISETFSSGRLNRKQKIGIYKPEKYTDRQAYPLIVVLNAETLMEPVVSMVRYYEQFGEMPKCIVVGVYEPKQEDVTVVEEVGRPINESARFFEFVSAELVPYIQGKYPIADLKGVIASEEAGFLANYYMLAEKKPTFNMIVSLNPVALPRMGEEFSHALAAGVPNRLFYYMATADVENKVVYDKAIQFERAMRSAPVHESVEYHFVDFKGSSVNAAKLQGIAQALDMCFDIYKPIGSKEFKTQMETLETGIYEYLENKYNTIYKQLGVKKVPILNDVMATYTAINSSQDWESLKKLAKYVESNGYLKTAMPNFFLAEYYEKMGDDKKALKTYQKAYTEPNIDFITGDLINERITHLQATKRKSKHTKVIEPIEPTEEVAPAQEEQSPTDESNQN